MRRGLASLIIGLSLLLASLAWAGVVLLNTVLDPSRSEELATELFANSSVQNALSARLASGLEQKLPPEVPFPRANLRTAAEDALAQPEVQAIMTEAIARAHRNALTGVEEPMLVRGDLLTNAGRDALVRAEPALDSALPKMPRVAVELPTTGFTWLSRFRSTIERFTRVAGLAAMIGIGVALIISTDRAAVLRRVAFWSFATSAFWLIAAFVIPRLAAAVAPTSTALVNAAIGIFFGAMIDPASTLAAFGLGLLAMSFVLPFLERRQGARVAQPRATRVIADLRRQPEYDASTVPFDSPGMQQQRIVLDERPASPPVPRAKVAREPSAPTPAWVAGVGYVDDEATKAHPANG